MNVFRQRRSSVTDRLKILTALNALSAAVVRGFNEDAALQIARTVLQVLEADSVSVTDRAGVLASAGERLDWLASIDEGTRTVLERSRTRRPTIFHVEAADRTVDVAVAVLSTDEDLIGSVHVVMPEGESCNLAELQQLASLISTQLQLAELEQSRVFAAEAKLQALRAQVSPHFLHNSLTAIAGLINADPARARSLIATLAEFLRTTFREKATWTTVAEELLLVESYLEIERARFGDRFEVRLNIAPEALPVKLPFLTIQPLVENAIRHGLERRPGPGQLSIVAENAGPEIAIHIEDNGVGIDPERLRAAMEGTSETTHVGVLAVDTRLRSRFGDAYGLTISTGSNAGTKVTLRLPKYNPA